MKGENCTLSVDRFGSVNVIAETVSHGISLISYGAGAGETRMFQSFYTSKRTSGSFDLGLVFPSYEDYERVMKWIERYGRWASNPHAIPSPMRVQIPSRNFNKTGIPETGITYGDKAGSVTYRVTLAFMGASSVLEHDDESISRVLKDVSTSELVHLYPAGSPGGGIGIEDAAFGSADGSFSAQQIINEVGG